MFRPSSEDKSSAWARVEAPGLWRSASKNPPEDLGAYRVRVFSFEENFWYQAWAYYLGGRNQDWILLKKNQNGWKNLGKIGIMYLEYDLLSRKTMSEIQSS